MNKLLRPLLAMAALAASSTALLAQPAVKLITVDIGKVFDGHYKSEEANAKFRDAEQKAREQAEELRKQGQTMVDEYKELAEQAKNTLLNADARTKAEQAAQKKLEEIQRKQADLQGFLQNTQSSLSQRIATKLRMLRHAGLIEETLAAVHVELLVLQNGLVEGQRHHAASQGAAVMVIATTAPVDDDVVATLTAADGVTSVAVVGRR